MYKTKAYLLSCLFVFSCASAQQKANLEPKMTETPIITAAKPEEDKYIWLEEVLGEKALEWVKTENTRSLAHLQSQEIYKKLESEALEIVNAKDKLTFGGFSGGYVTNFWQDAKNVRGLWRRSDFASWKANSPKWETILDFDELSKLESKNWVYKGANCLDPNDQWNTICLLSLSNGGKDANTKREFNVKTKSFVENGFTLPEAKSDVTWLDKDTLLVGTDWGDNSLTESGYPYIVKTLKRGQDLKDATEVFRGEKTDVAASSFRIDDGEKYHILYNRSPTFFTNISFYQTKTDIVKLSLPSKHSISGIRNGQLFLSIQEDWTPIGSNRLFISGSLLSVNLDDLISQKNITPEVIYAPSAREALQSVSITKSNIIVTLTKNVKSEIRKYEYKNKSWQYSKLDLPLNGVASVLDSGVRQEEVFYSYNDLLTPPSVFYSQNASQTPISIQSQTAKFNADGLEVNQYEVKSKDGTMVPYFIVHKKGIKLDGKNPTLLYGYGGFEISVLPNYSSLVGKLWLERGGVYIIANIRGGGEFGPEWHQAGLKTKRQVIYDDFISVGEDVVKRGITSPKHLGTMGGSNGGLLMGVMLTQRPDLFNAVVVQVPLLDMLRYHKLLAGASWIDEYGSPEVPEERVWLEKFSPYQNLKKRDDMPMPLIVTSTKDDRVHPAHARKFGAKMQELGMPFYYYENIDGGHSAAANLNETAKRRALEFTYLFERLSSKD